jgi:hypothetical protein
MYRFFLVAVALAAVGANVACGGTEERPPPTNPWVQTDNSQGSQEPWAPGSDAQASPSPSTAPSDNGDAGVAPPENNGEPTVPPLDAGTLPSGEGAVTSPPDGSVGQEQPAVDDLSPDEQFADCSMARAGTPCSNQGGQCWFSDGGCAIAGHCVCDQNVWRCTDQQMCGDCPPPEGGGWDHQGCN